MNKKSPNSKIFKNSIIDFRILTASTLGNALEFYEFTLFGFLAPVITKLYFPDHYGLILSYLIFAVGFIFRPLGGFIFGSIGDRYGRRIALYSSIVLMTLSTCCMGIIPSYNAIGIAAPLLLILLRIGQGMSAGGETHGSVIFAAEHCEKRKIGFICGLVGHGSLLGAFLASLISKQILMSDQPEFYWRFAFFLGSILGVIGFYIRRKLEETPVFKTQVLVKHKESFSTILKLYPLPFFLCLTVGGFGGMAIYLNLTYLFSYKDLSFLSTYNSIFLFISTILFGFLSDKMNRNYIMITGIICVLLISFFCLLNPISYSLISLLITEIFLCLSIGAISGPLQAKMVEMYPPSCRYRAIGFSFSLGIGLIAGTSPAFAQVIYENFHNYWLFWIYGFLIGIAAIVILLKQNRREQKCL